MKNVTKSFVVRVLTLIIGALSNFIIATLLIKNFGYEGYSLYVVLSSLPSLIPFADFGLGSNIFNFFADKSEGRTPQNIVTEVFLLSCLLSIFLVFISTLIILGLSNYSDEYFAIPNHYLYSGLGIISITLFSVPFSLAARKMFAEERISKVFFIQGLIPPITASLVFLFSRDETKSLDLLVFMPSVTYMITTLVVFKMSGFIEFFSITDWEKFRNSIRKSLTLGGWSLCVSTVIALVWQMPKYLIQMFGTPLEMTTYSLMSLFLIPGLSLTAVSATWHTTNVRRRDLGVDVASMTARSIRISFIASVLFSIASFIGFQILSRVGLATPDYRSQLIASIALISSPTWMIPLSTLTSSIDLRWMALRIVPCFVISGLMLSVLLNIDYTFALITYLLIFSSSVRYFSNKRFQNLRELQ